MNEKASNSKALQISSTDLARDEVWLLYISYSIVSISNSRRSVKMVCQVKFSPTQHQKKALHQASHSTRQIRLSKFDPLC